MKRIILALMVLATVASCKKDKNNDPNCEKTVAGIAASYKITKAVVVLTGLPEQNVTNSLFGACELGGVYQLKSDKTVVYTETATCAGNGVGNWDVVGGNITITFTSGNGSDFPMLAGTATVSGWDCSTLTISEVPAAGQTYKFTFTKQ